jgi:hypothetical protein
MPRTSVRPSPSNDNLQQPSRSGLINNHPRTTPSRDQLSAPRPRISSTPSKTRVSSANSPHNGDVSAGVAIHTPSGQHSIRRLNDDALFKRPSQPFMRQREQSQPPTRELEDAAQKDGKATAEAFDEEDIFNNSAASKNSRPSLSERAMETLSQLPPSPAVR